MSSFFERLELRAVTVNSLLCVGLDPHAADLPPGENTAEGAYSFCARLVAATADVAAAFKPNAAFFEAHGAAGVDALARLIANVIKPTGVPVVLDVKRGDISTTADAYADAAYDVYAADSVTVSGYMGRDSIAPFLRPGKGAWVLCKTSNPSSSELQSLVVASKAGTGPTRVFEVVAELSHTVWGSPANVGLVVGATDVEALRSTRSVAADTWILAPGVGFQGGDLRGALAAGLRADGLGLLLPVSRGISRAADPAAAARAFCDAINGVRAEVKAAAQCAAVSTPVGVPSLAPYQRDFFAGALAAGVLRFGSFTLKSGRISPYFFNAGNFRSGASLGALGATYASTIRRAIAEGLQFDVLFGPAYKGIPLVAAASISLAASGGGDVPFAYNRKEAKDHGEGGVLVGAPVAGLRVLIVDDVISAGTAVGESVSFLRAAGAIPVGVVIGLDRQERGAGEGATLSAVQQVRADYGIPVFAVATLDALLAYVRAEAAAGDAGVARLGLGADAVAVADLLQRIDEYRAVYGVSGTSS